jgi:hypothetical protein
VEEVDERERERERAGMNVGVWKGKQWKARTEEEVAVLNTSLN